LTHSIQHLTPLPGTATRLEFSSSLASGAGVRARVTIRGVEPGDILRLEGSTELQYRGDEDKADEAPDSE